MHPYAHIKISQNIEVKLVQVDHGGRVKWQNKSEPQ